jgi:transcriptional regulator with XRE-family HTH domain
MLQLSLLLQCIYITFALRTLLDMNDHSIHHGRNIKRFREMLAMKQDALAYELGDHWTQKKISLLEAKENIEPEILEHISKALEVPKEAIENFNEETAKNIISKMYCTDSHFNALNYQSSFNPFDKVIELYERMLKEKDDTILRLEKLLEKYHNN